MRTSTVVRSCALLASLAFFLAGCSRSTSKSGTAAKASGNLAGACAAQVAGSDGITQVVTTVPALQTNGPVDQAEVAKALPAIQSGFDQYVAPALKTLQKDAPAAIQSEVKSVVAKETQFRATGDLAVIRNATDKMDAYFFANCANSKQALSAVEYAYHGNADFKPGNVRIKMTNDGKELHQIVVFQKNPGVSLSFDELFNLPDSQSADKFHPVSGLDPVAPGVSGYIATKFTPGDYAMVCFISQGTTSDKEGSGPPHLALGMKKEFKVA